MRKENSAFNMTYLSQPGANSLHNNDYFGCSELDGFACYVVADGFRSGNDKNADPSARLAVEAAIGAFNQNPSIGKRAIAGYVEAAHQALKNNNGKIRLRASITVIVTDYQKLRYGFAGNCRFHLYRGGKVLLESGDHSLSWELMREGELPKDKIATHAERNNLQMYCGTMKAFRPAVSQKIKLKDMDVFSIFTRGIWENARNIDMLSAVQAAENDPQIAVAETDRLILDKLPTEAVSENYTVCFVFVDKVFIDPDAKKRRKRIIIISVIAFLVVAIIVAAIILYNRWRTRTESDMRLAYHNGVEYIQAGNFLRASEELKVAYGLAEKLWDEKHKTDINNHQMLVDAVVRADDLLAEKDYDTAVEAYNAAENQSRYADNLSREYIEDHREKAGELADVHGFIMLGDTLAETGDWDNAEKKYLEARRLASRLSYIDGKTEADGALDAMYEKKQQEIDAQKEQAQAVAAAAELIIEGDKALRDGDLVGAATLYALARDEYEKLGSEDIVAVIDQKTALLDIQSTQNEYQLEYAADYIQAGDEMAEAGEYVDAKRFYLLAREIYANLGEEKMLKETEAKIDLVDIFISGSYNNANIDNEGQ